MQNKKPIGSLLLLALIITFTPLSATEKTKEGKDPFSSDDSFWSEYYSAAKNPKKANKNSFLMTEEEYEAELEGSDYENPFLTKKEDRVADEGSSQIFDSIREKADESGAVKYYSK